MAAKDVAALLAALASHRKRKQRERANAPAPQTAPSGMEVDAPSQGAIPALPGPSTAQA
jgi:hypothetical protein